MNLSMFNMIKGINEQKTLAKRISCKRKCKFDGRKCNSNQINVDVFVEEVIYVKKITFEIPLHVIANIQQILWIIQ